MGKKRVSITTQIIVCAVLFLVAFYAIIGQLILDSARALIKSDIQGHMLDIVKTAAVHIDGDALRRVTTDDPESEDYQTILKELDRFQNSTNMRYIYCITVKGDKEFVYNVDPEDPEDFGMEVVYTDALYQASLGTVSVDNEPYTDAWGRFYSAYAPIYDSKGGLAGIVAADYEAEWFENQVNHLTVSIFSNGALSLIIGALLVFVIGSRIVKKLRDVNNELALLGEDIEGLTAKLAIPGEEESLHDNDQDTVSPVAGGDEVQKLGDRILFMRQEIEQYINHMNTQAHIMVNSLSEDYRSVYYVDLDGNYGICYRSHVYLNQEEQLGEGTRFDFKEVFRKYAENYVKGEYREAFMDFLNPDNIRAGLAEEKVISLLYISVHGGKESYEMMRVAAALRAENRDDGIIHAVSIGFTDVDAETRKTMQQSQALSDALSVAEEANKAKTAFLSNMSHEIRTPMNAIISIDSIAISDPEISEKTRDYLAKIGVSAKHLLRIINDILDMSRIEAGRVNVKNEEFLMSDLIGQINTIVDSQCNDRGLHYNNHLDDQLQGYYIGDALKLKQVLINILGNAVKFTEPGGTVSLSVEKVIGFNYKTTMRFIISDTGVGMDPEFIPKIFEAFSQEDSSSTSKYNSTGLGMAITKSIVEMMNGNIEVESEKNVGSTFTVTLTFLDSDREDDGRGRFKTSDLTVLVVSDNTVACSYMSIELGEVGITVETSASGKDAVEKIRLHEARNKYYNMVIIDREMIREKFLDVISSVRKVATYEDLVIVLMGYQFRDIADDAKNAGVDILLAKPVTSQNLIDKYTQSLNSRGSEKKEVDFKGRHILLAEDKEINAEIMTMVLQMREVEVDVAVNGKVAVDMYAEKEEGYYDAILMDMRMPEMDGITATGIIRGMGRSDSDSIPIIALTANAFDEDVERSLQAGLNAHLTKPVEPDLLFDTLRRLVKP
ncbi:MAG: response regulator [Lachnospiraceae bacterium]|nr:response regulator [Lachnospiraceae bacterium]